MFPMESLINTEEVADPLAFLGKELHNSAYLEQSSQTRAASYPVHESSPIVFVSNALVNALRVTPRTMGNWRRLVITIRLALLRHLLQSRYDSMFRNNSAYRIYITRPAKK